MIQWIREFRNKRAFQRVRNSANPETEAVCAYVDSDGKPNYFVMPRDADPTEVRAEAFRLQHGREMSPIEKSLVRIADERKAQHGTPEGASHQGAAAPVEARALEDGIRA